MRTLVEATAPQAYERFLVPVVFAPWAERLLERVAPEPGERVLDVACGTGIVARRAAARVGPVGMVVSLDVNQAVLEVARAAGAHLRPPIVWRAADAAHLPLPDAVVDVVVCQQGLQFFPDPAAALREMRRVLAPKGRLVLAVRFPSAEAFLREQAASSPLAGPVGALAPEVREALARDLDWALRSYVDDEGVVLPMQTWLVTANR